MRFSLLALLAAVPAIAIPAAPKTVPASLDDIVPGKYIVTLKSGVTVQEANTHVKWVEGVHKRSIEKRAAKGKGKGKGKKKEKEKAGVENVWTKTFKGYSGEFDTATIEEIKTNDDVKAVEPVKRVELYAQTKIKQPGTTWGLGSISHKSKASDEYVYWDSAGRGMSAYVIDTGINPNHVEFEGRATQAYNAVANTTMDDKLGHGTHCAGTLAGKTYGVAKKAKVMAIKVFDGPSSSTDIVLDGFEWAVNDILAKKLTRKSVISMSLGGGKSEAFNAAVQAAFAANIVVVVAAGNSGIDAAKASPASAPGAITVGAIDINNKRADFSNFGPFVDIFAPGVGIVSANPSSNTATATMSGTSMACPHVAGLVLMLRSRYGIVYATSIANRLISDAVKDQIANAGVGSPNRRAYNRAA